MRAESIRFTFPCTPSGGRASAFSEEILHETKGKRQVAPSLVASNSYRVYLLRRSDDNFVAQTNKD
jgi:hypothetical protein